MPEPRRTTTAVPRSVSAPKVTRPLASSRRQPLPARDLGTRINRRLDAAPDRIDIRDWLYRPSLSPLPNRIVNCDRVPAILDQGVEGACTGFALAALIQFHRARRGLRRFAVSPRMLYELARRYDEWPGEGYEGSSARGAMKAWVAHGVCSRRSWPDDLHGAVHFTPERADEARLVPGGAYYRVEHRSVRDMHAAIADVGIVYVTLMVHAGWTDPSGSPRRVAPGWRLPVIQREVPADGGHAVALVGYTEDAFIVQNSWGEGWGEGGFALLPYEDYLIHATDVWVAQVGVPVTIDLWQREGSPATSAGLQRAADTIPLADVRPYIINLGNNGLLSDTGEYWTTESDVQRLFTETITGAARNWSRKRVMLYVHGGLNSEREVARRVIGFRDVCLENEIYPLHIMWESGAGETVRNIVQDALGLEDPRAASWVDRFRDHLVEAKDRTFELTVSRAGSALWREMKENARLASQRADRRGGMQVILKYAREAVSALDAEGRQPWELHVVGHSAGSILVAQALQHMVALGIRLGSMTFLAPAITIDDFRRLMLFPIRSGQCPLPTLFVLSDQGELDDDVGPYGKSLLYLVSNAFEGVRGKPLLGMQRHLMKIDRGPVPDESIGRLYRVADPRGTDAIVVAGVETRAGAAGRRSESNSHGGFDNDPATMNSVLYRILGREPARPFVSRDLQF